jgi:hypothetical protein
MAWTKIPGIGPAQETQMLLGCANACKQAAMFTPSPNRSRPRYVAHVDADPEADALA